MSQMIMSGLTTITTITLFDGYDNICGIFDDLKTLACWFHNFLPKNKFLKVLCYCGSVLIVVRSLPYIFYRTSFFQYFYREIQFFHRSSGHNDIINLKKKLLQELKYSTDNLPRNSDGKLVILDLYAGSGNNLSYYPDDAVVIATDILDGMKEKFEENILLKSGNRDFIFINNPGETLDSIPDETVSCCVCFYSLCSSRGVPRTLYEIQRVLMPRGKVYFIEHVRENKRFSPMWFQQINFMPTFFLMSCCIRHTGKFIDDAGFSTVSYQHCYIDMSKYHKPMSALSPHIFGSAIK